MEQEQTSTFGKRLKQIRNMKQLTQREAAELVGVTAASLSAYENGTQAPSIDVAMRAATAFDVTLDWICGIAPEEEITEQYRDISHTLKVMLDMYDKGLIVYLKSRGYAPYARLDVGEPLSTFFFAGSTILEAKQGGGAEDSYTHLVDISVKGVAPLIQDILSGKVKLKPDTEIKQDGE